MTVINQSIKMALENAVVCRGINGAKESHEYAERMGEAIKKSITDSLKNLLKDPDSLEENIQKLISEIKE